MNGKYKDYLASDEFLSPAEVRCGIKFNWSDKLLYDKVSRPNSGLCGGGGQVTEPQFI